MQPQIPTLSLPQKLYGREQEFERLLSAFDRVRQGTTEALFISGNPGVGKTALVQEIRRPIIERNGYFAAGKYDQLKTDVPYSAIIQAFTSLTNQILSANPEQIRDWIERIQQAVGANGRIIIDVIPEIAYIIGSQPEVAYTDPSESQNRFNRVIQKFVGTFAGKEHPLVLFLDDLQWVDMASLNLIKVLITDPESKHLLIIGAFRDTEVDSAHPFKQMVDDLTKTGVSITATTLPPLQVEHVNSLIADLIINASCKTGSGPIHPLALMVDDLTKAGVPITATNLQPLQTEHVNAFIAGALGCPREQTEPLARIVFRKTRGNPLFIVQMLKILYEEKKLVYESTSGWKWNAEEIERLPVADSIVDLLVSKIHKLSQNTQTALMLASCIGNRFDLETLTAINGKTLGQTLIDISPAIQETLLIPMHSEYVFFHDRIREAAYSLLSGNEKKETHGLIGYFVLSGTGPETRNKKIFFIVDQLNLGAERIASPRKKLELAELNLMAGRKAKASTAFASAATYLSKGIDFLPQSSWDFHYDLTLELYMECSECLYLSGNFDGAEALFGTILRNAKTKKEKADVYRIWVASSQNKGRPREALQYAREGLRLLGLNMPSNPTKLSVLKELLKIKWQIGRRKPGDLAFLPHIVDPTRQTMADILINMCPAAYYYNKKLFSLAMLNIFTVSLQYEQTTAGPLGYMSYGFLIGSVLGDYRSGYEFASIGLRLSNQSPNLSIRAQCNFGLAAFINHWIQPLKTSISYFNAGYVFSLESGNFVYASYSAGIHSVMKFFKGDQLDDVQRQTGKYLEVLKRLSFEDMVLSTTTVLRVIMCLKGQTKSPYCFSDDQFDEAAFVKKLRLEWNQFILLVYYIFKLPLYYLFDELASALETSIELQKNTDHLIGMYYLAHHNFYYSLTLTALYPSGNLMDKWSYWRRLIKNQKKMKTWADNCPENFLNKYTLVAAEMARVRGDDPEAKHLYNQAITLSRENEFIQEEAIANELAAKFYLSQGNESNARSYLREARSCYQQWGAVAKVKQLEQTYPDLFQS